MSVNQGLPRCPALAGYKPRNLRQTYVNRLTLSGTDKWGDADGSSKQGQEHTNRSRVGKARRGRLDTCPFWWTQHKFTPSQSRCAGLRAGWVHSAPERAVALPMSTVTSIRLSGPLLVESRRCAPSRRGVRE